MDLERGKGDETGAFASPGPIKGPVRRQRRHEASVSLSSESIRAAPESDSAPSGVVERSDFLPAPFVFKCELGRGGMGVVYRAFDPTRNADVAIKFLPETGAENQVARRFQREANELATMSHPNIVAFYGAGNHKGRDYLVMELVDGGNLHDSVKARGGKLAPVEVAHLFAQIADGLAHIHDQGLVHRDFKPENILLSTDGVPKITDFGLARRMEERSRLTSAGAIIGTYSYLAPEQIISSDVGPAADLYAFGCCLYETLVGRPIFSAETEFALLNSHLREVPVALRTVDPSIPQELEALVLKLVKKAPEERPASAHEVSRALKNFLAKQVPSATSGEWSGTIGRQDIVARLEEVCARILRGRQEAEGSSARGVSCVFTAASGHGRSVVVRELVSSLRAKGLKVLTAVPQYGKVLPLREVYAALGGDLDSFARRLHYGGPRAAVLALREALERYPEPVLIVADDFMRMGSTTNVMLQFLAALEPPPGRGWLLSCSSARAASLVLSDGTERVELPPLGSDKIVFLAEKELGGPIEKGLQDWLLARSSGSVRRLRLYIYAIRSMPAIAQKSGHWCWIEGIAPPANYVEPIISALSQGADSDLKLLRAVCLMDEPFPFEVAAVAAGLTEEEADVSIDGLCRHGLLEEAWGGRGEHFCVASPEVKEAVLRGLGDRTKKRLHSRLVEAMGRRADAALRGRHEVQAQLGPESVAHLTEGADHLAVWGAFSEAAELWTMAHEVAQSIEIPELRWRIEAGTIESIWRSGHLEEAFNLAEKAVAQAPPLSPEAASYHQKVLGLAAHLAWLNGKPTDEVIARCESYAGRAGAGNVWLCLTHAEALDAKGHKAEALKVLESLAKKESQSLPTLYSLVHGRVLRALNRFSDALVPITAALGRPDYLSVDDHYALKWEQIECHIGLKAIPTALELVDSAISSCIAAQEREWEARLWGLRGRCGELQEDWEDATQSYRDGVECARGGKIRLAESLVALGYHLLVRRKLADAETTLREVLQTAQGDQVALQASLGLGIACTLSGRSEEAQEWLQQAHRDSSPAALLLQADLAFSHSNAAQVAELLEKVNPHLRPMTLELGMALTLKGLLGHPVDREQILELLSSAPSLTPGDPLRALRADWLKRVQALPSKATEGKPEKGKEAPIVVTGDVTKVMERPLSREEEAKPKEEPIKEVPPPPAEPIPADGNKQKMLIGVGLVGLALVGGLLIKSGQGPSAVTPSPTSVPATVTPTLTPTPTPTPVPENLVIDTVPEKGQIQLMGPGGKEVCKGTAPLTCPPSLPPGEYQARITRQGCLAGQFDFNVDSSLRTKTFTLEQLGRLHVEVSNPPVMLKVDSDDPDKITVPVYEKELRAGHHKLVFSSPGFEEQSLEVDITAGKTASLPKQVKLSPAVAEIEIVTKPAGAKVLLDGKDVGRTEGESSEKGTRPLSGLRPGQHELKVVLDGYTPQTGPLVLKVGKNAQKVYTLERIVKHVYVPPPPPPRYNPPPPRYTAPPPPPHRPARPDEF